MSLMKITQKLREQGIRVTPQRRAVYEAMCALCHSTVEQVEQQVRAKSPSISPATIYKILDSFASAGIIGRLSTEKGKLYYDISPCPHAHIISSQGVITDYADSGLVGAVKDYLKSNPIQGVDIERVALQIFIK